MLFKSRGQKSKEIQDSLKLFCARQFPDTPARFWLVPISKAIKFAHQPGNMLIECPYVDMYTSEIDFIDEQQISNDAKRVLFAIMVQKK